MNIGALTPPVLSAAPVTVRHIIRGTGASAVNVLGATFVAQSTNGVNGRRGFQSGKYDSQINDEGSGTLTLPNTVGDDGVLHRRRFAILTDDAYHPGDEWIEVLQDGRVLFVGTPVDRTLTRTTLTLELADALWMANTQRETAAGFWTHSPRDVFEHYSGAWVPTVVDDFDNGADPAKWTKDGAFDEAGAVRLQPAATGQTAYISPIVSAWPPGPVPSTERVWRAEMTYDRYINDADNSALLQMSVAGSGVSSNIASLVMYGNRTSALYFGETEGHELPAPRERSKNNASLAIEGRDRWLFFYVDGALVWSVELDTTTPAGLAVGRVHPFVRFGFGSTVGGFVRVKSILMRKCAPFLMRGAEKGDYRLPGLLPAGGLKGTYYDEADLSKHAAAPAKYYSEVLAPTRQPYARRQDATINFPTSSPAIWQPPTPPNGEWFSVRWTGAIYLDLAAADVLLRLTQLDDGARLWVGKTLYGQQLLNSWQSNGGVTLTSGSLRTHLGTYLGTSVSGWYPIRIDYAQGAGPCGIVFERSVGGAAYEVVPATALSPLGIYEAQVRYDSHAEQLKAVALAYGLQYRCESRALESGEFPGAVVPRVRVGRDTDKVLTPQESTEVGVKGSAGEVIDTLLADAAGLADQTNAAQLTAESVNFAQLLPAAADRHMMMLTAYESLADITDPVLLQARLASMLGLRTTPWEEVSARPRGHTELRDSITLSGDIARFDWEPGDGLRVVDEQLDLADETPRPITGTSWPLVPDGRGAPSVRFRQRPRSQKDALRALVRATLLPQRNYQGQLVVVNGSNGAIPATGFADIYSRVSLPLDRSTVVSAFLVVQYKSNTSVGTVTVNGVATAVTFSTVGRYDVTAYVAADGTFPRMYATVTGTTGSIEFALELVTRI
ncbi:MAG: PA14 domain-containing protein [Solirubrobacteraceae bacterium]